MNTYSNLLAEGRDYAAALIKHNIDPYRALRLMADQVQRQALESYIDSLVPPPVPGIKAAKLDKVSAQVARCRQAAKASRQCLAIKNVKFV